MQACEQRPNRFPQVSVAGAPVASGLVAQPSEGVVPLVQGPLLFRRALGVQQVTVFRHEQEHQPVDQAQDLAVVVLLREDPGPKRFPQRLVAPMAQEPPA